MKKYNSIIEATVVVTALVILEKILGFGRQGVIAAYYGANAETDAFFFAQGMPSMLFPAIGNSLALAFTSAYTKRMTERGELEGDHYASRVLVSVTVMGIILSLVGILISPLLVPLFAPGFSAAQTTLAVRLTRIVMGAFTLTLIQYIFAAVLNSKKLFSISHIANFSFSLFVLAVTILLGSGQSVYTLTLTVVIGTVMQTVVLVLGGRRHFHGTLHDVSPIHPEIGGLFKLALPILLGNSVTQLNNIVDKALGSTLEKGALSALSYANTLDALVICVFVMTLSSVLYPTLVELTVEKKWDKFERLLITSLSSLSMLLIPISVITFMDAKPIIKIVYGRGNFDETAVAMTALVLACYAPRFFFAGIHEVISRVFFSVQDTKTPMVAEAIGVGCNIVFSLIFVRWLGVAGIALGTVVSVVVIAAILVKKMHTAFRGISLKPFYLKVLKQLIAAGILIIGILSMHRFAAVGSTFLRFFLDVIVGFLLYFGVLVLIDKKGFEEMLAMLRKKKSK